MPKFQTWLERFREYFFGIQGERGNEAHPAEKENRAQETRLNRARPTYKNEQNQPNQEFVQPKMTYQYAKPGKFRFPLIEDANRTKAPFQQQTSNVSKQKAHQEAIKKEPKLKRRQVSKEERVKETREKETEQVDDKKSREKFNNPHFKPTVVPSPIYGFNPYPTKKGQETESFVKEEEKVEPVESLRINAHLKVTEDEVDFSTHKEPEMLSWTEKSLANKEALEEVLPDENEKPCSENDLLDKEIAATVDRIEKANELTNEKEEEVINSHNKKDELPVGEALIQQENEQEFSFFEREEINHETRPKQNVTVERELQYQSSNQEESLIVENTQGEEISDLTVPTKAKKETTEHVKSKKSQSERKKESTTSQIPFNVMMLPYDNRKLNQQAKSTGAETVASQKVEAKKEGYQKPSIQLLKYPTVETEDDSDWLKEQADILEETLNSFNVDAKVVHMTKGPSVTRFEIQPARGVKVTKVTSLTDDIKLSLAAKDIRMEAPIPGKNTIGIEVPNRKSKPVFLREILRRKEFIQPDSPLTVALGLDISGQPIVTDLKKMPHGMVAGATGSGKSVCINSILVSLLYKATPDEVKLMLIDPKMVELAPYNGLAHLVTPVITDAKQATVALKWVVAEMERRYELFSQQGVRDIGRYNERFSESKEKPALPYMLVVIDELADLMMVSPQEVEDAICRIAQKARACGIHLLLATQRPSVDVITGLIKANIPTRVAFSVSSQTDSRTILDMSGAERLLGKGDMLFHENGTPKPIRVQGTFVSDEEIEDVIDYVKKQREPHYLIENAQLEKIEHHLEQEDELFEEACYFVVDHGSASASSIQRRYRVGYNRAARLIDLMEAKGVVSEAQGSKPRHVLMDGIQLEEMLAGVE
ncbi:DNA translocase FtsK [Alkalihalobacillus sp. 1P02AB]|uniref:DNA translocase FtsK n=1 Tax=Alkalihalobacillus sp. 1P02AB TaxID=3132260 RepID=UPI0039A5CABB